MIEELRIEQLSMQWRLWFPDGNGGTTFKTFALRHQAEFAEEMYKLAYKEGVKRCKKEVMEALGIFK